MKLLQRGSRTEGVSERCEYHAGGFRCKEPSAGELRAHAMADRNHGIPWGMCAEHVKPQHHPPDLRKHLFAW